MYLDRTAFLARCLRVCLSACLVAGSVAAFGQDTLRIATYNLLNYPTDASGRDPFFRTVLHTMHADVLVVQEMTSPSGVTRFRDDVLNAGQPGTYNSVPFNDGPDTDNAMFYRPSSVTFLGASYIATSLRNIAEYRFMPAGGSDTIRLYSLHLKGNQEDSIARLGEATILRNYLNALPAGSKFIVAGDFNIYRSTEPAFLKLIGSEADNDGRSKDPLNAVGTWHANYAFRAIHTQSTRTRDFGNGTTGGMDDRFDMLLVSYPLEPQVLLSTYTAYGNDGNHYNDSINQPPNLAVADSVADGLHYASDHLPVFADVRLGISGPDTGFTSIASGSWSSAGVWSGNQVPTPAARVTIGVGTTITIDGAAVCQTVSISGTLQFDGTDGRSLTTGGEVGVAPGGELRASGAFGAGSTTQSLTIGGSFVSNGLFTPRMTGSSSGTRVVAVTFTGALPTTISGTAEPMTFHSIRMSLASQAGTLTPLVALAFSGGSGSTLTLSRGTWVQSVGQTVTPGVNITVDSAAVLSVSDGGAFSTAAASLLVRGVLDVSGGSLNVGAGINRLEVLAGGRAGFSGGTTTVNGRLTLSSGSTTITGGQIAVNPRGSSNLAPTSNVFEAGSAASVAMTGGAITIVNPKTASSTGREVKVIAGTASKSFSGGTIFFGDGVGTLSGSDSGFVVESAVPLPDVVLRTGGIAGRDVTLAGPLAAKNVELRSGALRLDGPFLPGFDLTVAGSLKRIGGLLSAGARAVTFTAPASSAPDTIAGDFTGANGFSTLLLNSTTGVCLEGDIGISQSLSIGTGLVTTGTSTVFLDSNATFSEPSGQPLVGNLSTTRRVVQNSATGFGGIGVELTARNAAPGVTTVTRTTGVPYLSGYATSILRSFHITAENNAELNARLIFSYHPSELEGQEEGSLRLWRSTDDGLSWVERGGAVNITSDNIVLDSIDAFSDWTASDAANPLHQISIHLTIAPGWNMLSNPVTTPRDSVSQLFPLCGGVRTAFQFDPDSGYSMTARMLPGRGYWLKCSTGADASIGGSPRLTDSLRVVAGWNMIGSISEPVDTGLVIQVPPAILATPFYEYEGAYVPADTVFPGRAYWVKAAAPGSLVLPAHPVLSRRGRLERDADNIPLTQEGTKDQ